MQHARRQSMGLMQPAFGGSEEASVDFADAVDLLSRLWVIKLFSLSCVDPELLQ
jgi:hypothetical protein